MDCFNVVALKNKNYLDLDEVLLYLEQKTLEDKETYQEVYQTFRILKSLTENSKSAVKGNL